MPKGRARRRFGLAAAVAAAILCASGPVLAQGWWPWSNSEPERPPVPEEPVYREPPAEPGAVPQVEPPAGQAPANLPPPPQSAPAVNWSTKNPICLQLENRLVQEGHRGSQMRDALPDIEAEMRQVEHDYQSSQQDLERSDCYEYFLFSKSLRRTRKCVDLAKIRDQSQRRLSDLEAQRQQVVSSGGQSYRDDIVRELARNYCGANYSQEARRLDRNDSSSFWQDEDESNFSNPWSPYTGGGGSTYRTVCVRLCDGFYFPVSFSTLPSHFAQDDAVCQSKCAAPVELYYYQNPGAAMDQSIAFRSQEPYTSLKSAFRYRKELVRGCSCKEGEYVDPDAATGDKRAETTNPSTGATTGWEARSEPDAQKQKPR
jgi:hypothetical protein